MSNNANEFTALIETLASAWKMKKKEVRAALEALGVEEDSPEDFCFLTSDDFGDLGLKVIQVRKGMAKGKAIFEEEEIRTPAPRAPETDKKSKKEGGRSRSRHKDLNQLRKGLKTEMQIRQMVGGDLERFRCPKDASHMIANVDHYMETGEVAQVCMECGAVMQLDNVRYSFVRDADGTQPMLRKGLNPRTGVNEDAFEVMDCAVMFKLLEAGMVSLSEAYQILEAGTLYTGHHRVAATRFKSDPSILANIIRPRPQRRANFPVGR